MITRGWTILGFALASWLVAFALIVGLGLFAAPHWPRLLRQ